MKKKLILFLTGISCSIFINAQIKVISDGKVGVGTALLPTSQLELGISQYLKLNSPTGKTGILFYETGTTTATDIQYGAKIFYDADNDRFSLVTRQNNVDNYGICIQRTYGKVGIGMTSPSYSLDVNGVVRATSYLTSSDVRLKTDINDFNLDLTNNLISLNAKTYKPLLIEPTNFNNQEGDRIDDPRNKIKIGFIAQDVQKLFPELVNEDENGYLSVDYMGIIPIVVEAYKKQNLKIIQLEKDVEILSEIPSLVETIKQQSLKIEQLEKKLELLQTEISSNNE